MHAADRTFQHAELVMGIYVNTVVFSSNNYRIYPYQRHILIFDDISVKRRTILRSVTLLNKFR